MREAEGVGGENVELDRITPEAQQLAWHNFLKRAANDFDNLGQARTLLLAELHEFRGRAPKVSASSLLTPASGEPPDITQDATNLKYFLAGSMTPNELRRVFKKYRLAAGGSADAVFKNRNQEPPATGLDKDEGAIKSNGPRGPSNLYRTGRAKPWMPIILAGVVGAAAGGATVLEHERGTQERLRGSVADLGQNVDNLKRQLAELEGRTKYRTRLAAIFGSIAEELAAHPPKSSDGRLADALSAPFIGLDFQTQELRDDYFKAWREQDLAKDTPAEGKFGEPVKARNCRYVAEEIQPVVAALHKRFRRNNFASETLGRVKQSLSEILHEWEARRERGGADK